MCICVCVCVCVYMYKSVYPPPKNIPQSWETAAAGTIDGIHHGDGGEGSEGEEVRK